MTKTKLFGIIAATAAVSALLGVTMISESESQQPQLPTANDVVIMRCSIFIQQYAVVQASTSANAPAVALEPLPLAPPPTTNCAQTLSDLLDAGFELQNVAEGSGTPEYTLIR